MASCRRLFVCCLRIFIFLAITGHVVSGERTSKKIYDQLDASFSCFRRLNATHQIGCSSTRQGNVGVIHYVANASDLEWLLDYGPYAPYTVIIDALFFNRNNLTKMQNSGKVNGILVLSPANTTGPEKGNSPDHSCPNERHGLYNSSMGYGCERKWNPYGDGMFFDDWKFPIFLIQKQQDIDNLITNCYYKFNAPQDGKARSWPLCAGELLSNMYAAKDSPTCIRRSNMITTLTRTMKVCDPLGDYNIWSFLKPMSKEDVPENPERSVIVVAARIDSFSMFDNMAPGGDSALSGLVALLAIAEALTNMTSDKYAGSNQNVMFLLLNGESFDYIGSSRVIYDMQRGLFPYALDDGIAVQTASITPANISYFIELNQVGLPNAGNTLWAHSDERLTAHNPDVQKSIATFVNKLQSAGKNLSSSLTVSFDNGTLPPSSLQLFLKEDSNIPGIVLTDHQHVYTNKYYNGMFDNHLSDISRPSSAQFIASVASALSTTLHFLLTGEDHPFEVESARVEEIFNCYLKADADCGLFELTKPHKDLQYSRRNTTNMYVGVDGHPSMMGIATSQLLAYLMKNETLNVTQSECVAPSNNSIYTYKWMVGNGGFCVRSTVNTSVAASPAFEIEDYDYSSGQYSTWTESVWDVYSLRIFVKPSQHQEVATLCIGILVLVLSFVSVWFLTRSSDVLFTCSAIRSAVSC